LSEIVIVGLGIKLYSHLTQEALAVIQGAEKLYYLTNEPVMSDWLENNGNNSQSLEELYFSKELRCESYDLIVSEVLSSSDKYKSICFAAYGHPLMLNEISEKILLMSGPHIETSVIPGISTENVMFCDLGVDPLKLGLQSYEATYLLASKLKINTNANLVLWQAGVVGVTGHTAGHNGNPGIDSIQKKLQLLGYAEKHIIYFYEASLYPQKPPVIIESTIKEMSSKKISTLMTLFVPAMVSKHKDVTSP